GTLKFQNAHFEENKAYYGGEIWTSLPLTIEKTSFTGNEAIKSEPSILPNGKYENNGYGGAIYSNLHAYMPEYDDGSMGPLVQPPTSKDYYLNINTDATTVFKNNKAFRTFTPPSTKDEFDKLLYQSTSHPGTKYDHPLNNDDVNLIVFNEVIFDLNYETEDPIHAAYLVLEKSKLGEDFPEDPKRQGYQFVEWNTQKDGKGTKFTKDTVIEGDITLYAIYEKVPETPTPGTPTPGKSTPSSEKPSGGKTAKPKTKPGKGAPKTGDAAILSFYAPAILVAGGAMAFLRKRRADR
ncbi:MAG: InlB B-repeat-containing protein, partial [Firmicutes bacterium]|nr:InlB B-repeat-containing protein [Bacillota bacterium]